MKLTVGMGSIDEYIPYIDAGADEVFCGYVPSDWALNYNIMLPLNRREVLYYNVQLGSESELLILADMKKDYGIPVVITLNALYYLPEQYPYIIKLIKKCYQLGYNSYIVADPALLYYLQKEKGLEKLHIMISGEMAEQNHLMMEEMKELGARRIIFHRKMTLSQMESIIERNRKRYPDTRFEYEAFLLNEMCHFHGGFCQSFHCDELCHMCLMPYRLEEIGEHKKKQKERPADSVSPQEIIEKESRQNQENMCKEYILDLESKGKGYHLHPDSVKLTGSSGCGLCMLWKFREIGITHLKLVSRGNYMDETLEDIRQVKKAFQILEKASCEKAYIQDMKQSLFPDGHCSGNCYYRICSEEE